MHIIREIVAARNLSVSFAKTVSARNSNDFLFPRFPPNSQAFLKDAPTFLHRLSKRHRVRGSQGVDNLNYQLNSQLDERLSELGPK